jgi:hypothetical protein
MKILINYADKLFLKAQQNNTISGLKYGFDKVIEYKRGDIDNEFCTKNAYILNKTRGAGYWLWKPYFILKTLELAKDDDVIFYADSGSDFIDSISPLIDLCREDTRGTLLFRYPHLVMGEFAKRDAFYYTDCDIEEYHRGKVWVAGFQVYRKTKFALEFVREVLHYCCDSRIITDDPNVCGLPNLPIFQDNRHDQTVLSLMAIKHNITPHKNPQCECEDPESLDTYGQIIYLHRNNA